MIKETCGHRNCTDYATLSINLFWQIWKDRNKGLFEGTYVGVEKIIGKATNEWTDFEMANQNSPTRRNTVQTSLLLEEQNSSPADSDCLFINIKSAVDSSARRSGSCIIARKRSGDFVAVWASSKVGRTDKSLLEAKNIHIVKIKAKAKGWEKINIISNNKSIIDRINAKNSMDMLLVTLLEDIIFMSEMFSVCSQAEKDNHHHASQVLFNPS
ncbi:hypothetical protein ACH5RR_006115 [Cinchona calisaya]|uniref:RNase H type-1 domain-containing protein n=1 Tax=Cinchona calisaya TaxID=153742 RepID=A0ABD3ANE4_9GENT